MICSASIINNVYDHWILFVLQGKWLYGGDPFEPLHFAKPLEQLK
jgi:hypothetical protein